MFANNETNLQTVGTREDRGKEIAGKRPNILITDGLPAYHDAFNKEFLFKHMPSIQAYQRYKVGWGYE